MAFEFVIIDVRDHVGEIALNRPEKRNALNRELLSELLRALDKFDADDNVRCMLISGSGRDFSAGADIGEMAKDDFSDMFIEDRFGTETRAFAARRKPIIAAVSGRALGGGCELAMMCDMIIAAEDAVFGQPEINLGVIAGLGGHAKADARDRQIQVHGDASYRPADGGEGSGRPWIGVKGRAYRQALGASTLAGGQDRPHAAASGDGGQGSRQPCGRAAVGRRSPVRKAAVSLVVRGPKIAWRE